MPELLLRAERQRGGDGLGMMNLPAVPTDEKLALAAVYVIAVTADPAPC